MLKFRINAIGKLKKSSILDLIDDYKSRIRNNLEIFEYEAKKSSSIITEKINEAKLLLSGLPKNSFIVSMDEKGELLSSHQFAELLQQKINIGYSSFVFFIGGANGLDDSVRNQSDKILALGKITLPHMLARLILVEQLYRAECIMDNHPYNK